MNTFYRVTFHIGTDAVKNNPDAGADYYAYRVQQLKRHMATLYRGFSIQEVQGGWMDGNGDLIEETSLKAEALVQVSDGLSTLREVSESLASLLADEWDQECVLVTIDTVTHAGFIEP